jgi:hypothetical protein
VNACVEEITGGKPITDPSRQLLIMRWPDSPSVHKLAFVAPVRKGAMPMRRRCALQATTGGEHLKPEMSIGESTVSRGVLSFPCNGSVSASQQGPKS